MDIKKVEELLAASKLTSLLRKEEANERTKEILRTILIVVAAIAAMAAIAFIVYKFFAKDDFDDFDEDLYFEDDDIEDLLEDEDLFEDDDIYVSDAE